jgi:MFS family permease
MKGRGSLAIKSWWRSNVPSDPDGRRFVSASLVNNLGSATQETILPLFLVQIADIPATQVGLGYLVAGAVGLAFAPFAGRLCDRLGPKQVLTIGYTIQAMIACCLVFVDSLALFCGLVAVAKAASQVARIGRMTLVIGIGEERRNTLKAQMNVFSNVGVAAGMAVSAIVLSIGTREAYLAGFVIDALTFVAATLLQRGVAIDIPKAGRPGPGPKPPSPWRSLFVDYRYTAVVGLNGFLFFHQNILFLGIPLWIASTGELPRALATAIFFINFALSILLQVRFASPVKGIAPAARSWRRSAVGILFACMVVFAATQLKSTALAVLAVAVAAVLFTLGELWYMASELEISAGLAPDDQRGLYQGMFGLGRDIATTGGPLLAAFFCVSLGASGWLVLATLYGLFAAGAPAVVRWADRSCPQPGEVRIQEAA